MKRKTAKKTPKVQLAPPSPRNGNRLPVGNHAGNTGGKKGRSGRTPEQIRERLRQSFDSRIGTLEEIADSETNDPSERARILELMAKYSLGTVRTIRIEGMRGAQQAFDLVERAIRTHTSAELADEIIKAIHHELERL